jgi:nitronate monooxygenase
MIHTRLTDKLGLKHPIFSAPMALAAGGRLAAAVSRAGGLGFVAGGYGDPVWLARELAEAGDAAIGCGLITWALRDKPEALEQVLAHKPRAVFLSFDDPAPYVDAIRAAGATLVCQVQTLADARRAADCGADVLVAQGAAAGGHGEVRTTMTLVPEVADWLASHHPDTLLLAAGGVVDGRGLAAVLMLGADGAVVGSRFWASQESLAHPNMVAEAVSATGDASMRSRVSDVARGLGWPARYSARVLENEFTRRWHRDLDGLRAAAAREGPRWTAAWKAGDVTTANVFVGEATGMIHDVRPAAELLDTMVREATALLARGADRRGER